MRPAADVFVPVRHRTGQAGGLQHRQVHQVIAGEAELLGGNTGDGEKILQRQKLVVHPLVQMDDAEVVAAPLENR